VIDHDIFGYVYECPEKVALAFENSIVTARPHASSVYGVVIYFMEGAPYENVKVLRRDGSFGEEIACLNSNIIVLRVDLYDVLVGIELNFARRRQTHRARDFSQGP
jgi:hypothetical protein